MTWTRLVLPEEQTALLRKTWLEDYFPVLVADRSRAAETVDAVFRDARLSFPHFAHANQEASLFDFRADLPGIRLRYCVASSDSQTDNRTSSSASP